MTARRRTLRAIAVLVGLVMALAVTEWWCFDRADRKGAVQEYAAGR